MVAQSPNAAIANADAYTRCEPAMCLKYVRTWLEIPSREADAQGAWDAAQHKHPGDRKPPEGAPAFWKSGPGGSGHGHITLVRNNGMRTTDKSSSGYVSNDDGSWPHDEWGQDYLGWTEDLNGVHIPYLVAGGDWRASGDVYVSKLHQGQQDSDSVARLRYRLTNHAHMPDNKKPGYGGGYGEKVVQAVEYWISHLDGGEGMGGPKDGSQVNNGPANRLFGPNYNVIEE
jgi:hypothetical protein